MLLSLRTAAGCNACQDRLVDESLDPPVVHIPDYAESKPVAPSPLPRTPRGPAVAAARQPAGALTGKIVFTNGGHGWTFDPANWRLQRGVSQEMNEDYGNLDQMNLFAAYCFNAGAVVVPMRPLGHQPNEVVLDNDDPEVTWTGTWADSTSTYFFGDAGDVPYRYAALADIESATATYTPNIPVAGFYPVYTWVRAGSDRGLQLYRIRHTGGETLVRIPHHMVGNGWIYLGEYFFNAGSSSTAGAVVVSNLRGSSDGNYTFADAIRFGNGMGSLDRGTGVSTYPREDENCRYWIEYNLGQGQSDSLYNGSGNDENDSWSAPPKMSAEMNREQAGSTFDRIHISFHSNAGGGRGTLGLITSDPTPNQSVLAQLCGNEVTQDLVALGSPPLEVPWQNRTTVTYSGGYSEIDGSLFNYEMDATIIEVAFHDSVDDSKLMRDPKARMAVGKASMHAVIRYMNRFAGVPLAFPPESPVGLSARGAPDGSVLLRWNAPVSTGGSGAPAGYVIYRSTDGRGFGMPVETGNVTWAVLTGLSPGTEYYFRVAAANAAGESLPSAVAGTRIPLTSGEPRVLVVNAFDRLDRFANLRQDVGRQAYASPDATGAIERVLPLRSNAFDYVVPHGRALGAGGRAFDSCPSGEVAAGRVTLTDYPVVIWACGQESTADETFSAAEQVKVTEFRTAGGHLMVSGSEIAWDLDRSSGPTAEDRAFLNSQLHADLASDAADQSASYTVTAAAGGIFAGLPDGLIDDGSRGIYRVLAPDVLTAWGSGVKTALTYSSGGAAALQYDGSAGGGRVVIAGFPFETLTSESLRAQFMARVLDFLLPPTIYVPAGASWKYRDTGVDPGTGWATVDYNDAAWPAGAAQLGFGEGDEATVLNNNPSRTTTWFRRSFTPGFGPRELLRWRLLRDDGAAVRLNGAEIFRSNLPDGTLTASTQALTAVTGADENVYLTYHTPDDSVRTGTNVIAVDLHQAGLTSSDLSFDLELSGIPPAPAVLIPSGAVWRYRDNNTAPSAPWITTAYNDTAWSQGRARLGYGGDGELTTVNNGGNAASVYTSTWFRHVFTVSNAEDFEALKIDLQRDDGLILWLNGSELLRDNLPSSGVSSATFATTAIGGTDELAWRTYIVPAAPLTTGTNVLAAELHQASLASSDTGFDLRLTAHRHLTTPFATWQAATFGSDSTTAAAAELADPDGDGRANLLEYALGSRPLTADTSPALLVSTSGNELILTFRHSTLAESANMTIQTAASLNGPWVTLASSASSGPVAAAVPGLVVSEDPTGSQRRAELRDPTAFATPENVRRFFRLAASRIP